MTPSLDLPRARQSLRALALGDAFGNKFFHLDAPQRIAARTLPPPTWYLTDDSIMACSVFETLALHAHTNPDALAHGFGFRYAMSPHRGYGPAAHRVLAALHRGEDWRLVASAQFQGQGSFGNGAAMRIPPLGAALHHDLPAVVAQADLSAQVTHTHPEGRAGAIAAAVAAALLARSPTIPPADFLHTIADHTPPGLTHQGLLNAQDLPPDSSSTLAARALGNGSQISAQDTVPLCCWITAHHRDLVPTLWFTVSAAGDRDTTCAIVAGILGAMPSLTLPPHWLERQEPLSEFLDSPPL